MKQLKMYRRPDLTPGEINLPEGYGFSRLQGEEDKLAWLECCKNGLVADDAGMAVYEKAILGNPYIRQEEDVMFLDYMGNHVGTVTAYVNGEGMGYLHMIGLLPEHRGRGLGKYLVRAGLWHLYDRKPQNIMLTTDEWRTSAVCSYLNEGFLPVDYDEDMAARWEQLLCELGVDSVQMLTNDAMPGRRIYAGVTGE